MSESNKKLTNLSSSLMIILTSASVFLLLYLTIMTTKSIYNTIDNNNKHRSICSYLTTIVNNHDYLDAVSISDDGKMLVLSEKYEGNDLEVRIYCHQQKLIEEYTLVNNQIDPTSGNEIAEVTDINFELVSDNLLKIKCDDDIIYICLEGSGK